ncbi:MAG: hybrid sensor histidine kinase/response regulator [Nitrospinota bacterium]|nr:hybrid sensor histidine kinase/response regulator [Nitrospinota bacterium]
MKSGSGRFSILSFYNYFLATLKNSYTPVFLLAFLLFVATASLFALNRLEYETRKNYGQALETVLDVAHEAVSILVEDRVYDNKYMAINPIYLDHLEKLSSLSGKKYQMEFHEPHIHTGVIGYALVRSDFTIAALSKGLMGRIRDTSFLDLSGQLSPLFKGESVFLPPRLIGFSSEDNGADIVQVPTIVIASPIRHRDGTLAGALLQLSDPAMDFSRITHLGRMGRSGETYAFNIEGKLLTDSRFHDQLINDGLIMAGETCVLKVSVKDPGGRLAHGFRSTIAPDEFPFTLMAKSALSGNRGLDINAYNNYRGERVLGAWLWDERLGMGLATEIDEVEVLEDFNKTKFVVGATLIAIGASAIFLFSLLVITRRKYELSLIAAKEAAEKADKAKSLFMASISHELRTPLTSIIGFSEQVASENLGPVNNVQKDAVQRINKCGEDLLRIINSVLDYVRLESGKEEPILECVNLEFLVVKAIVEVEQSFGSGNIRISMDCWRKDSWVLADEHYLKQIFVNLLSNAIKYGGADGVINVSCHLRDDSHIRVSVKDHGPGMPKEKLESIFEPFNRIGKEGLNVHGSGIGLSLVRKMTEAINGRIIVESQLDHGTVVHIDLPLVKVDQEAKTISAVPSKILYVEDDPDAVEVMKEILGKTDYNFISSATGLEGISLARSESPDVILLDIGLPDVNGYEVLLRLKSDPKTSQTPVIAITAKSSISETQEGLKAGFATYMIKPIHGDELRQEISRRLVRHDTQGASAG